MVLARKIPEESRWPGPPDLSRLSPEERVNTMIEMSSVMGELVLDSIRDQHPGISEARLLSLARKRIFKGRSQR